MRMDKGGRPSGRKWQRPLLVIGVLSLTGMVFFWGRNGLLPLARAVPPLVAPVRPKEGPATPGATAPAPSDYSRRVVAYINDTMPITREELGEYLIARQGAERLELLVNKKIIEMACKEKGIEVTAAEVNAALAEDVKGLGVNVTEFVTNILKQHNKTLYEWKEDVIRPRLLLGKLCQGRVQVTPQDLQEAFDAHYGEQVECRLILFPRENEKQAMAIYPRIRDDEKEFIEQAKHQASPSLAMSAGLIKPFGRHSTGNEELEKEAFSLKAGEVSAIVGTPEGLVVLRCVRHIPPTKDKKLETERAALEKEIVDKKIQREIPIVFNELREKAHPNLILKNYTREDDLRRDVRQELSEQVPGSAAAPRGN